MRTKQAVQECEVFSALTDAELEMIAGIALEREYDAGATIFHEGDRAEELFVIQEGKIALQMTLPKTQSATSRRITVDVVTGNEVVGWSALVEPHTYTLSAICLQEVKALSLNGSKLRHLLQENSKVGYEVLKGLIKVVASRLDETRHILMSERFLAAKAE